MLRSKNHLQKPLAISDAAQGNPERSAKWRRLGVLPQRKENTIGLPASQQFLRTGGQAQTFNPVSQPVSYSSTIPSETCYRRLVICLVRVSSSTRRVTDDSSKRSHVPIAASLHEITGSLNDLNHVCTRFVAAPIDSHCITRQRLTARYTAPSFSTRRQNHTALTPFTCDGRIGVSSWAGINQKLLM